MSNMDGGVVNMGGLGEMEGEKGIWIVGLRHMAYFFKWVAGREEVL